MEKIINRLVAKVKQLPNGTETNLPELLNNDLDKYSIEDLFKIQQSFYKKCMSENIILDYSKHNNELTGLQFYNTFKKKEREI